MQTTGPHINSDPEAEPDSEPRGSRRRGTTRAGLAGAVLGVGAAVGALVLVTSGAGASSPSPTDAEVERVAIDESGFEAHIACVDELFASIEEGEADVDAEMTDEAWHAFEAEIDAGIDACDDLLPEGVVEQMEVDEAAFEQCLIDQGIDLDHMEDDEMWIEGNPVVVATDDGETVAHFGDGDGSIHITKEGDDISVMADGDVTIETLNWEDLAEWDASFADCEGEFFGGLVEWTEAFDSDDADADDD